MGGIDRNRLLTGRTRALQRQSPGTSGDPLIGGAVTFAAIALAARDDDVQLRVVSIRVDVVIRPTGRTVAVRPVDPNPAVPALIPVTGLDPPAQLPYAIEIVLPLLRKLLSEVIVDVPGT